MANPTCGQISARLIRLRKKPEMALFLRTVNLDLTRFLKFNRREPAIFRSYRTECENPASRSVLRLLKRRGVPLFNRSNEAAMSSLTLEVVEMLGQTIAKVVPITIGLALAFSVLTHFWACNPGTPWWRKRELITDVCYWFFVPLFARVLRIGLLVLGAQVVFKIHDADELIAFYDNGHGPLSQLPLWLQALLFLVLSDFMLYWLHRLFHGGGFWKYHAIHHSSEELDWISAARFHPVNLFLGTIGVDVILLMAGISPNIMLWVGPFTTFHSAFVHANLNWTLGPFKYVLATPVFHRWHHTSLEEGGDTNFAGTFPIWDILFGTFRMPVGRLPQDYGADDPRIPNEIVGQLAYPFRQ
jgi:sterol desaturase/sphingolipid hydroxylase (fatty acid hydroxylase superfamily)